MDLGELISDDGTQAQRTILVPVLCTSIICSSLFIFAPKWLIDEPKSLRCQKKSTNRFSTLHTRNTILQTDRRRMYARTHAFACTHTHNAHNNTRIYWCVHTVKCFVQCAMLMIPTKTLVQYTVICLTPAMRWPTALELFHRLEKSPRNESYRGCR